MEEKKELHELFKNTKVRQVEATDELKRSFISYAMAVNVSRAIPDVRDGLKPVHRRILYSMGELGNFSDKPYKKCARIVGEVMGKYHPHGDSSIYDALVRLAQDFSIRYPLIDGHGNFGSVDGCNQEFFHQNFQTFWLMVLMVSLLVWQQTFHHTILVK